MGDDSCSKGCGFESQHRILDGHFFTLIYCRNCIVCLKRPKINETEARVGAFFNNKKYLLNRFFTLLLVSCFDDFLCFHNFNLTKITKVIFPQ